MDVVVVAVAEEEEDVPAGTLAKANDIADAQEVERVDPGEVRHFQAG